MNTEQFQQFIEMMTRSIESQNRSTANWKTESENEEEKKKGFYHLLAEQFALPERQHHWQIELNSLKQQEFEK
ncbi:31196_t:CDS:2, partial [Gigaspora margarita]